MREITDATIHTLEMTEGLVLVDVNATWCPPCKAYGPVLEQFSEENNVSVYSLDADENPQTMIDNRIMSIPTTLIYFDGRQVESLTGARSYAKLENELKVYLDK